MPPRSPALRLDEDMHVHSTWSDGEGTIEENVASARARGLVRLGCVDHVRIDSAYVPDFVRDVRRVAAAMQFELEACVEAKILDTHGALDAPRELDGVDRIYAADHQVPTPDGPRSPRAIREAIETGNLDPRVVIDDLFRAMSATVSRHDRLVLAHPFSVLPKCRLDEAMLDDERLAELAALVHRRGAEIEVDERWRCPSLRVVQHFVDAGVVVRASSDSHRPHDIGRYVFVADLAASLTPKRSGSHVREAMAT